MPKVGCVSRRLYSLAGMWDAAPKGLHDRYEDEHYRFLAHEAHE